MKKFAQSDERLKVDGWKPGVKVRVYETPYTREKIEGEARAMMFLRVDHGSEWEHWMVDFNDGHGSVRRLVHPMDMLIH